MKTKIYPITPQPKVRMTRSDKWKKRPAVVRYFEYCNRLRELGATLPECGSKITFFLPMPQSWSKKKREAMNGKPHQQKPDLDNLIKALCDAIHKEDQHIWHYEACKLWGVEGGIMIEVDDCRQKLLTATGEQA
jgi:Holliday junction resolvase RusA-like endonuclease